MLRFLDAGESHGKALLGIVEGFPGGLPLEEELINRELQRRQGGYGRGKRMEIEQDKVEILSGIADGKTMGSPIGLLIGNKDWHYKEQPSQNNQKNFTVPRPGHADLAGVLKYDLDNYQPILERASARKTAMRTAIGSIAGQLLKYFSVYSYSHVIRIGSVSVAETVLEQVKKEADNIKELIDRSVVYCLDADTSQRMCREIEKAKQDGDTLGGIFEVVLGNIPPGLGSHVFWDRQLDSRIGAALISIPAIKAIEIGNGIRSAESRGTLVQDAIYYERKKESAGSNRTNFYRKKNWAGGIEGGITNGEEIVVSAYMKPIPTLLSPLHSVDLRNKKEALANYQRSDYCAVPAASVVGEAVVNWEVARVFLEKFAGDSLSEIENNFNNYLKRVKDC